MTIKEIDMRIKIYEYYVSLLKTVYNTFYSTSQCQSQQLLDDRGKFKIKIRELKKLKERIKNCDTKIIKT